MELLLYHLIDHIKKEMPELSLVDEDYGQLEAIARVDMTRILSRSLVFSSIIRKRTGRTSRAKARKERRKSVSVSS